MARKGHLAGVDEIACLVDFVDDPDAVLGGIDDLAKVREQCARESVA
jgi:hypothetical protein